MAREEVHWVCDKKHIRCISELDVLQLCSNNALEFVAAPALATKEVGGRYRVDGAVHQKTGSWTSQCANRKLNSSLTPPGVLSGDHLVYRGESVLLRVSSLQMESQIGSNEMYEHSCKGGNGTLTEVRIHCFFSSNYGISGI